MGSLGGDMEANIAKMNEGDISFVPQEFKDQFRVTDQLAADESLATASYIAVIQLGILMEGVSEGPISPLSPEASSFVHVDLEAGQAFVPVSLYLGSEAAFSLEFVWVDDGWQFSPYSLLDSVNAANRATETPSS